MKISAKDAEKILNLPVGGTYCLPQTLHMIFRATPTKWACENKSEFLSATDIKKMAGMV